MRAHELAIKRNERATHHFLRTGTDETGVDELDRVHFAVEEAANHVLADDLGVQVRRIVGETVVDRGDLVSTETEVHLGLATDRDDGVVQTSEHICLDLALRGTQHASVVATAQTAIRRHDDVTLGAYLGSTLEDGGAGLAAGGGEVLDDLGDLVAIRHRGMDSLLRLDDSGRRNEFHGASDLLRCLDATNASPKNSLLSTGHRVLPTPSQESCPSEPRPVRQQTWRWDRQHGRVRRRSGTGP